MPFYGTPFVTKFSRSNYTKEVNEDVTGGGGGGMSNGLCDL